MTGNISAPMAEGGTNKYPNGAECIWDIVGELGFHVEINFYARFDVEDTFGCANDYLMVILLSVDLLLLVVFHTSFHF